MKVSIVGIHGKAGAGKDTVADSLIAARGYKRIAFSDPMYRIMKLVQAQVANDDAAAPFEIFKLLVDLFGGPLSAPPIDAICAIITHELPNIARETHLFEDLARDTKPREFLQYIGTEYFRSFDENIWCNYLTSQIFAEVKKDREAYFVALETNETKLFDRRSKGDGTNSVKEFAGDDIPEPHLRYVISDVRYANEITAVHKAVELAMLVGKDVFADSVLIKLQLPRSVAVQRIVVRDDIPADVVESRMGHSSENELPDELFNAVINADQPVEGMLKAAFDAVKGIKSTIPVPPVTIEYSHGARIVDLSKFKKQTT